MTRSLGYQLGVVEHLVFLLAPLSRGSRHPWQHRSWRLIPRWVTCLCLLILTVVVVGGTGFIQGTMLGVLSSGCSNTFGKA